MARPLINSFSTYKTNEFVSSDWLRQLHTSFLRFKCVFFLKSMKQMRSMKMSVEQTLMRVGLFLYHLYCL